MRKDTIEAALMIVGFVGFMVGGLGAMALIPGSQLCMMGAFFSMGAACFSAEM